MIFAVKFARAEERANGLMENEEIPGLRPLSEMRF